MHAVRGISGLALSMALAAPVCGQVFFPAGMDCLNYVPHVPETPAGRIYVGDFLRNGNCHFRKDLPSGKGVTRLELVLYVTPSGEIVRGMNVTRGEGNIVFYEDSEFERVDRNGAPCDRPLSLAAVEPPETARSTAIRVSNDADSFAMTCDGRFAVVVGANSATPVSLVDMEARAEVDKFSADSNVTYAETFDDGESVVVVANVPPQNTTNRLRRLRIVAGKLVDTGESLGAAPAGDFPDYRFQKVFGVAGSHIGVATAQFGVPQVVTFSIPGLQPLDTIRVGGDSAVVSCTGDRLYLRNGSQIRGYTLDPVTGALGQTPILTVNGVGQTDPFASNFANTLALAPDGAFLIVPEGTGFPDRPETPRTTLIDTTTGARFAHFDPFEGGSPTLVDTLACCAEREVRLEIHSLASGQLQIAATGQTGRTYELQRAPNLTAWKKLAEFQMPASPYVHTDPDPATNAARFYRLKLSQ